MGVSRQPQQRWLPGQQKAGLYMVNESSAARPRSAHTGRIEQPGDADDADQPAEVPRPAVAQVDLAIHVRQHGADRAAIGLGDTLQDPPVDRLQAQAGGQAVEPYGARDRPHLHHVEISPEWVHTVLVWPFSWANAPLAAL